MSLILRPARSRRPRTNPDAYQALPPLNSLVAFEAAASIRLYPAAAEVASQGAISRQIRLLESYLGAALFQRAHRSIYLTPTGEQYYRTICRALGEVAQATAEIRQWRGGRTITVATTQAMAALWLLPRITDFQRDHEEVDLRIVATDQLLDWKQLDCDIALFYCRQPPEGLSATSLFPERVFPVCSPAFLERQPDRDPQALLASRRLCLDALQQEWIGWREWFELLGLPPVRATHENHINNYPMLIQAAINGQGLALAWDSLVDEPLKNGSLLQPLPWVLETRASFCLLEPQQRGVTYQAVDAFRSWVLKQAEQHRAGKY
ncbi:MAG: LysR substrate-binding domain-containing protein [Thiolinea sp.]